MISHEKEVGSNFAGYALARQFGDHRGSVVEGGGSSPQPILLLHKMGKIEYYTTNTEDNKLIGQINRG